jgi:DNA-binding CsgD family transcriptional regulator
VSQGGRVPNDSEATKLTRTWVESSSAPHQEWRPEPASGGRTRSDPPRVRTTVGCCKRPPDVLSVAQWTAIVETLRLSNREAQIVREACYDESVLGIAARLRISPHTVHTHTGRLFRKLNVNSLAQAIALAFATHVMIELDLEGLIPDTATVPVDSDLRT